MAASEPSPNSSYQFAHVLTAYAIAMTAAHFGYAMLGVGLAAIVATVKEWIIDPIFEHDALGWRNPPPHQDIGGSAQDYCYWLAGTALAFVVLRWF